MYTCTITYRGDNSKTRRSSPMLLWRPLLFSVLGLFVFTDGCPVNKSSAMFKMLIDSRNKVWHTQPIPPWQLAVDDKLGGYMYALHHGVPTPKVYACSRGFPHISPEAWGTNSFVMKPLSGFNSIGVVVSDNGIDMMSKLPVTNENVETIYKLHAGRSNSSKEVIFSPSTDFMVEEYLRPKGEYHSGGIPADVKFEIYDGKIILIHYIQRGWGRRGTRMAVRCVTLMDGDWRPLEGLFFKRTVPPCQLDRLPPAGHKSITTMALKMARGLGVYYRIDMFFTQRGPVLGEFTPWSANGLYGEELACHVLNHWRGDNNTRAIELANAATRPGILQGWEALSTRDRCERVRRAQQRRYSNKRTAA